MFIRNDGDEADLAWILLLVHLTIQRGCLGALLLTFADFATIDWPVVLALAAEQGLHLHACHGFSCPSLLSFLSV